MALIQNAKGRRESQSPSGYTRLFGIEELGNLISRLQSAVISSGTELEKLIWERVQQIDDIDQFIRETQNSHKKGIWVAIKKQIKKSKIISSRYEPDFLVFDLDSRTCYIIEVKDGDQFDTKKAGGEHATLYAFMNDVAQVLPFATKIYICSFNAKIKKEVYDGLKHKFSMQEVLTGRELCVLMNIDYSEIIKIRTNDQQNNLDYFTNALLKIESIKSMFIKRLKK